MSGATGNSVESRALVEAYRLKKLSPSSTRTIEKALHSFSKIWQEALQEIVEKGQYGFKLPSRWYITADARFETIFGEIISNDAFLLHSSGAADLNVHFIDALSFSGVVRSNSTDETDAALAIAALFAERLL